ncbi:aryl-alcohol dehydrogenase [Caulobacter ginsengisoli]|uniref:Aryl-alcohol dehydrogenase n=1 Tax=Caulobacter ginsengisoli TaxID=400775 RepID=A0ABU0ISG2_9CAUL|nr:NAD(P)-dependent alcohol dehydrogenase [Caulobacter ginsengisoli]MDQ0464296.1 aryl-alcohol dehydrogenase [Caulobacter ginsengisoli]
MQVTAAVARAPGADFTLESVELDDPRPDEILVRIAAVGVCHTDLVAREGAMPFSLPAVLGHEGAGVVEKVGSAVTKVAAGDRVAITFRSCGQCGRCKSGDPAYCYSMPMLNYIGMRPDGTKALQKDGTAVSSNFFGQSSFATYALAYETNVLKLPADIPFELAAPLGCGVQTGAGGIMLALACPAGSSLLITGGGAVGLSAVMGAVIQGCGTIIVVEPHAVRRDLAQSLGATHVIDPAASPDLAGAVRAILPQGVDYAFDTTGRGETLTAVMGALAPKGVFGIVGIPAPGTPMPGDLGTVLTFGQTVRGIIEGDSDPDVFLPVLIDHWRGGRLPLEKLVKTYPFGEINAAIAAQHHGDCVKVVLTL